MECIICGSTELFVANKFKDYVVMECSKCHFGIVDPIPDNATLERLYNSKEYFDAHMLYNFDTITNIEIDKLVTEQQLFHQSILKDIVINPEMKMLEIGPGGGFALKAFNNMGFEVTGLETSSVASSFIRERLGLQVINLSIEEFQPQLHGRYDLILLNHVLEHFLNPKTAMAKLASLLNPGGILYIRVPDHDSYDRKKLGTKWPAYAQYHISNFSEQSLRLLHQQNGLKILSVKKFVSTSAPYYTKILSKVPFIRMFITNKYNGRTISLISTRI